MRRAVKVGRSLLLFLSGLAALPLLSAPAALAAEQAGGSGEPGPASALILLPAPREKGPMSVEEAIASRRTRRGFGIEPLTLEALSQLLWAAQGITGPDGRLRAAPSAGALYPLDIYIVAGRSSVEGLDAGVYRYDPGGHGVRPVVPGDVRAVLARSCLGQQWVVRAPVSLVVVADYERNAGKYGRRGQRYAFMESGHVGQNIFLQAEALGLAAGIVGAFHDEPLARALHLPPSQHPVLVMPVGRPAPSR